jgi:hypothetical protein
MSKKFVNSIILFSVLVICITSCTPSKLAIPSQFSDNAAQLHVKGLSKKHMSFGDYKTSKIKRGWAPGGSRRTGSIGQRMIENRLLRDFGITGNNIRAKEKGKFQFDFSNSNSSAEIYAQEKRVTNSLRIRTGGGLDILNDMRFLKNYEYSFTATIVPDNPLYKEPWKLFVSNIYKAGSDTSRKLFEEATGDENGYATDGKDSIFIRPVYVRKAESKTGKESKMLVKRLGGYELSWEDGVVCIVDAVKRNVWMYNDLNEHEKFILAAIASAIMLRRVQDIRD